MKNIFQKDNKEELNPKYVQSIFESYGAYHPIVNPAILSNTGEVKYIQSEVKCFFCDILNLCDGYVPSRQTHRVIYVCKPCMQDFNMFIFNSDKLEYCRLIKLPRTHYVKNI